MIGNGKEFDMEKVVYSVDEIQEMLGCGRNKIYNLVNEAYEKKNMFRVIRVGKNFLIPKESFHRWLDNPQ